MGMFGNRSFTLTISNGKQSRLQGLKNVVPQGSVLALFLFNIYILRPANYHLRKVCICWRLSNHACWWRLTGSGQGHGNLRWIPPDLEAKAQYYKNGVGSLPPQQQGSQTWASSQPQQQNPGLHLRTQIPRSNVRQVAHVSPTPHVTSQKAEITRRTLEAGCWLWLGCWSNNIANSRPSLGAFNSRVPHSCLSPQCSQPPLWPRHQRRLGNCDWMPASYTSGQPSYSCRLQVSNILSFVANELHFL